MECSASAAGDSHGSTHLRGGAVWSNHVLDLVVSKQLLQRPGHDVDGVFGFFKVCHCSFAVPTQVMMPGLILNSPALSRLGIGKTLVDII